MEWQHVIVFLCLVCFASASTGVEDTQSIADTAGAFWEGLLEVGRTTQSEVVDINYRNVAVLGVFAGVSISFDLILTIIK